MKTIMAIILMVIGMVTYGQEKSVTTIQSGDVITFKRSVECETTMAVYRSMRGSWNVNDVDINANGEVYVISIKNIDTGEEVSIFTTTLVYNEEKGKVRVEGK